ncbi:MAG: hypothetical protein ABSG99_07700 [Sedimentisphaerales bacterium]
MTVEYSVELCRELEKKCRLAGLHRPIQVARYDSGAELVYDVTGITKPNSAKVRLVVEEFIGGGFAGQVYKVKILEIEGGLIGGLEVAGIYAMKILIPPSGFARLFRNALYWIGFQGPFQLQVNPAAARAGALWQKFIRRVAKIRFGDETKVVDVYATFVDNILGSCGELSEWVEGRTWRLEVDEHIDLLKKWRKSKTVDSQKLGSPEYKAKYYFMHDFVKLLHEMGAYEFARQYEWSTCKSQPNCLKRIKTEDNPSAGLVAVDFRAGLALLPFLPMSPGDFKLIWNGLKRGSLVQFDRGDLNKLKSFINNHKEHFEDMHGLFDELTQVEDVYRNSVPDITHNHIRLLYSKKLWTVIFDSAITGWKIRNIIDEKGFERLRSSKLKTFIFFLIGLLPFLGGVFRKFWYHENWRRHYIGVLTSLEYFKKAFKGKIIGLLISWHRAGRISHTRTKLLLQQPWRILFHLPFLLLVFPSLHRLLTDWQFAREKLYFFTIRPVKLYFNTELRRQWLFDMVKQGQKKHILTDEDARTILSQIDEPYIDQYLKSLAVHICCLPVTQIVSMIVAAVYIMKHPGLSWKECIAAAGAIMIIFHVIPVSPGSIVRGVYVVYLVIRDKSFKDYNIAAVLAFFKIIGYLAFPIQMTYRYPALARFMAAHWATDAVHSVPVFGERGALLEHWIFCLFYNWPLTIRHRMRRRAQIRASMKPRYWHAGWYALAAALIFGIADLTYLRSTGELPGLKNIWWLVVTVPLLCGMGITLGCRGAAFWKRIVAAVVCGVVAGALYTMFSAILSRSSGIVADNPIVICMWRVFVFAVLSTIGAVVTELKLPEPNSK